MPQDADADQSPRIKQAVAGRSSSVSPPQRKLTGGTDRAGYPQAEQPGQPDTPASHRELVLTRLMGLFFDITLGLLAVTEGPNYVCCARKCCTVSQPVARHTPSCEQIYSSAASSAPIRCGWPVTNGCTAIAM